MGLFFRPGRPIARLAASAATTGVPYPYGQQNVERQDKRPAAAGDDVTRAARYRPPLVPQKPGGAGGAVGGLDHLVELHRSGALTDAQFSAAKATLLGL
jgi:hypothetical protein